MSNFDFNILACTPQRLWDALVRYEDGDHSALKVHTTLAPEHREIFWDEVRRINEKGIARSKDELLVQKRQRTPKRFYWGSAEEKRQLTRLEGAILASQEEGTK